MRKGLIGLGAGWVFWLLVGPAGWSADGFAARSGPGRGAQLGAITQLSVLSARGQYRAAAAAPRGAVIGVVYDDLDPADDTPAAHAAALRRLIELETLWGGREPRVRREDEFHIYASPIYVRRELDLSQGCPQCPLEVGKICAVCGTVRSWKYVERRRGAPGYAEFIFRPSHQWTTVRLTLRSPHVHRVLVFPFEDLKPDLNLSFFGDREDHVIFEGTERFAQQAYDQGFVTVTGPTETPAGAAGLPSSERPRRRVTYRINAPHMWKHTTAPGLHPLIYGSPDQPAERQAIGPLPGAAPKTPDDALSTYFVKILPQPHRQAELEYLGSQVVGAKVDPALFERPLLLLSQRRNSRQGLWDRMVTAVRAKLRAAQALQRAAGQVGRDRDTHTRLAAYPVRDRELHDWLAEAAAIRRENGDTLAQARTFFDSGDLQFDRDQGNYGRVDYRTAHALLAKELRPLLPIPELAALPRRLAAAAKPVVVSPTLRESHREQVEALKRAVEANPLGRLADLEGQFTVAEAVTHLPDPDWRQVIRCLDTKAQTMARLYESADKGVPVNRVQVGRGTIQSGDQLFARKQFREALARYTTAYDFFEDELIAVALIAQLPRPEIKAPSELAPAVVPPLVKEPPKEPEVVPPLIVEVTPPAPREVEKPFVLPEDLRPEIEKILGPGPRRRETGPVTLAPPEHPPLLQPSGEEPPFATGPSVLPPPEARPDGSEASLAPPPDSDVAATEPEPTQPETPIAVPVTPRAEEPPSLLSPTEAPATVESALLPPPETRPEGSEASLVTPPEDDVAATEPAPEPGAAQPAPQVEVPVTPRSEEPTRTPGEAIDLDAALERTREQALEEVGPIIFRAEPDPGATETPIKGTEEPLPSKPSEELTGELPPTTGLEAGPPDWDQMLLAALRRRALLARERARQLAPKEVNAALEVISQRYQLDVAPAPPEPGAADELATRYRKAWSEFDRLCQRYSIEGMVFIRPGQFTQGRTGGPAREGPPHPRIVATGFYIEKFEVTNALYKDFCDLAGHPTPRHWKGGRYPEGESRHPVVNVSWNDAMAYAAWIGRDLPTETEWEYAARGRSDQLYPWGNEFRDDAGACNTPGIRPLRVGAKPLDRSPSGCQDMAGNVSEWTRTPYQPYRGAEVEPGSAPKAESFIYRGGSIVMTPAECTLTARHYAPPTAFSSTIGFRCVKRVSRSEGPGLPGRDF